MGFSVGITTNGTLIDMMSARHLLEAGLNTIAISVDGIGKSHDEFRSVPGALTKQYLGYSICKDLALSLR